MQEVVNEWRQRLMYRVQVNGSTEQRRRLGARDMLVNGKSDMGEWCTRRKDEVEDGWGVKMGGG